MKYQRRVEYLACLPEIRTALEQGHSVRTVYETLYGKRKISMSYGHFCRYVSGEMPGVQGVRPPKRPKGVTLPAPVPSVAVQKIERPKGVMATAHAPASPGDGEAFVYNKKTSAAALIGVQNGQEG